MRRAAPTVLLVLAVLAPACGLQVTGAEEADAGSSTSSSSSGGASSSSSTSSGSSGSSSSSSSSSGNQPDAGSSFCARAVGALPPVRGCVDLDSATSGDVSPYGFDYVAPKPFLVTTADRAASLAQGRSLRFDIAGGIAVQDRSGWGAFYDVTSYPKASKLTLEADIVVEKMTQDFAMLVGFRLHRSAGGVCDAESGISVNDTQVRYRHGAGGSQLAFDFVVGKPFHVRMVLDAKPGAGGREDVHLEGQGYVTTDLNANRPSFAADCDAVEVKVGAWNTSQEAAEGMPFRYDNVVYRSE